MKTIVYCDRMAPHIFREFIPKQPMKRIDRIQAALKELRHTGNVNIYLSRGDNKPLELIVQRRM